MTEPTVKIVYYFLSGVEFRNASRKGIEMNREPSKTIQNDNIIDTKNDFDQTKRNYLLIGLSSNIYDILLI